MDILHRLLGVGQDERSSRGASLKEKTERTGDESLKQSVSSH